MASYTTKSGLARKSLLNFSLDNLNMNLHMTLAEISNQSITIWMLRYLLDFLYLRCKKEQIFSRPQESAAVEHQRILESKGKTNR